MDPAEEWRAEVLISVAGAEQLVGRPVSAFAQGWDKTVFRAGDRLVAFCRRAVAAPGMRREIAVLPLLAGDLPVRVPVPLEQGTFGDDAGVVDDAAAPW